MKSDGALGNAPFFFLFRQLQAASYKPSAASYKPSAAS